MIEFVLRLIVFIMALQISSQLFPTFWGGVYSLAVIYFITSIRVVDKEEKNERP